MTQEQKLEELAEWLEAHGISYYEPLRNSGWHDRGVRLVIPNGRIAVAACKPEDEDALFRDLRAAGAKPFFARNSEDISFILSKMSHALKGWNIDKVRKEEAKEARRKAREEARAAKQQEKKPRKRQRIHVSPRPVYEKVTIRTTRP